jgi:hypothetical protein
MMASVFKILAPFGFVRVLLTLGQMPLYPEQSLFRAQVTDEDYRYWTAAVCRDLADARRGGGQLARPRRGRLRQR